MATVLALVYVAGLAALAVCDDYALIVAALFLTGYGAPAPGLLLYARAKRLSEVPTRGYLVLATLALFTMAISLLLYLNEVHAWRTVAVSGSIAVSALPLFYMLYE